MISSLYLFRINAYGYILIKYFLLVLIKIPNNVNTNVNVKKCCQINQKSTHM